jgi:hypothetical protein
MIRKPLVLVNGELQQIQPGDYTQSFDAVQQTNNEVGSLLVGTPVYNDTDDTVKKARANSAATKDVIGLVFNGTIAGGGVGGVLLSGPLKATAGQWDAAFGTSGGLTKGVRYFLSDATAGIGTDTAPSADGSYVVELGQAMSPTELRLSSPFKSIKL